MLSAAFDWAPALTTLGLALLLDTLCGELPNAVHPVAWMGRFANLLLRFAPARSKGGQLIFGACVVFGVALAALALSRAALAAAAPWPLLRQGLEVLLFKSMFALRALGRAALQVRNQLNADELGSAQHALRSLCSRDGSELDSPAVVGAAVESLAENASDSLVAPLFYYIIFGISGSIVYRAVNTLDAMIGYHGRYEYLGKAAARLDDLLNFIPARLTALLLVVAGWCAGYDARGGLAIWLRDGSVTESPNAGRPMATMAGLLGVELVKIGHYRLGEPQHVLEAASIDHAWRLVRIAALLAAVLAALALQARHVYGY